MKKKKEGLSRLLEIAGQKKGLLLLAGLLSVGSAMCMLVPYWAVYEVLKELLLHGSNPVLANGTEMIRWGWIALGGLVGGLVLLYAALMSSHVAAFRILYGLRVRLSEHIGKLPLGYLNNTSIGSIKKTMDQNIEKIEGFIAHTIPDLVNVIATVAVMFVIFFSLNVWLTVACLTVVVLSLFLQFSNYRLCHIPKHHRRNGISQGSILGSLTSNKFKIIWKRLYSRHFSRCKSAVSLIFHKHWICTI